MRLPITAKWDGQTYYVDADGKPVGKEDAIEELNRLHSAQPEATRVEALDKVTNVVRSYDYESPNKVLPYVVVFFPDSDYASRDKFAASLTPSPPLAREPK